MKLSQVPRPFICGVIIEPDPGHAAAAIKLGEADGAHAFELNVAPFPAQFRNRAALASVFRATSRPVFTTFRRSAYAVASMGSGDTVSDEVRMQTQLDLIDVGSMGFDMEMDTFDPVPGPPFNSEEGLRYSHDPSSPPREVTHDARALDRQRQVVADAHRRGGEVMASAHTLTRTSTEDVLRICRQAEDLGCDHLKVVRFNASPEDLVDTLATTVALQRHAKIPYVMMAMGEYGKLSRLMAPLVGSMLCYCKHTYGPQSFFDQPLIRSAKAVLENVDYRITPRAQEFAPEWYRREEIGTPVTSVR